MPKIATADEKLLTAGEFANQVNIRESTVRAWLLSGKLCKVKIGRRLVRIPASEIGRIIEIGYVPARKERQ